MTDAVDAEDAVDTFARDTGMRGRTGEEYDNGKFVEEVDVSGGAEPIKLTELVAWASGEGMEEINKDSAGCMTPGKRISPSRMPRKLETPFGIWANTGTFLKYSVTFN